MVYNTKTLEPLHALTESGLREYMNMLAMTALEYMYIDEVLSKKTYVDGKMIPTLHPLQTFDEFIDMTKEHNRELARRHIIDIISTLHTPKYIDNRKPRDMKRSVTRRIKKV